MSSGLGCILEWYDFSLYGFFAPVLAKLYFPSDSSTLSFIKTLSIFSVGFFARPLGALFFGYISDKYGRVTCLKITPLLITLPTLLIALIPTYQQIHIFAPILLILARILQGLCIGGEFSNNIIYFCETASINKRYFSGSIGAFTGSIGILLASCAASLSSYFFDENTLLLYGWRIAFIISLLLGIGTYVMRRNMSESLVYQKLNSEKKISVNPLVESYQNQLSDYVKAIGLIYFPATAFYFIFMFLPNYLNSVTHFNSAKILGDNSISLLSRLSVIPLIGFLADRWSGIKMLRLSCLLFLILSIPLFYFIKSKTLICLLIFGLLSTLNSAIIPGLIVSILKPNTRSTIFSFTFNFSFGVFGGIVPALGFLLINVTGNGMTPIYYLFFTAMITLVTTFYVCKDSHYE